MIHVAPRSIIRADPRRPRFLGKRRPMLAVWCWCGRFYTVTPEQAEQAGGSLCPNPECGKGAE